MPQNFQETCKTKLEKSPKSPSLGPGPNLGYPAICLPPPPIGNRVNGGRIFRGGILPRWVANCIVWLIQKV